MNLDTALAWLDRCLRAEDPLAASYKLTGVLKEKGIGPERMYHLFLQAWMLHEKDPDPEVPACLELVLDCIRGDCHPDVAVF